MKRIASKTFLSGYVGGRRLVGKRGLMAAYCMLVSICTQHTLFMGICEHYLAQFEEKVYLLRSEMNNLLIQNANLRQTRDLLLPKLVTGEMEV